MSQLGQCTGIANLDFLGILRRSAQSHGNVIGHLVTRHRNHRGVTDGALGKNSNVGGTTTDINQAYTQLHLVIGQDSHGRSQLLQNGTIQLNAATADALLHILGSISGAGHHMHPRFQTYARHTHRLAYALLLVDDVVLRQGVQNTLVGSNGHRLGCIQNTFQIPATHFTIVDSDTAVRVLAIDMTAGQAHISRMHMTLGQLLRLVNRFLDRLHRGLDINHHSFPQPACRTAAHAHHMQLITGQHLCNQRHHLGGANIQSDDHVLTCLIRHLKTVSPTALLLFHCHARLLPGHWRSANPPAPPDSSAL